ncbi:MAG: hypothetical protein ACKVJK_16280, partial [Methylophagaceae bacterium]
VEGDNGIICHSDTTIPVILYCLPSISLLPVSDTCEGINSIISFDTTSGTNPIETWNWDYGGSIVSSDDSSYVLYSSCDDYLLTVEVQDSALCSAIDSVDITVLCNTVPEFTLSDSVTCGGSDTIIAATQNTSLDYLWLIQPYNSGVIGYNPLGPGGISQTDTLNLIFYNNPGPDSNLYTISVSEEDNFCSETIEHTVTVYPIPIIDFVIDTLSCGPFTEMFDNISDAQNSEDTASMNFW